MTSHPKDKSVDVKSNRLAGRRIALAICGGIGAVESVKNARELRRHGAEVFAFFTPSTEEFITELSVEWASGHKVIKHPGADVDHLGPFDLVIVAPATLNTISKSSLGLSDNAVTLLIAGQLGRKAPILFVPAMNEQLRNHPLYDDYTKRLQSWGARFHERGPEEDRIKMPPSEELAEWAFKSLS